jgi:hypothetical protein
MLEHHVSRKDQSTLYNYWYQLSIREKAQLQKNIYWWRVDAKFANVEMFIIIRFFQNL